MKKKKILIISMAYFPRFVGGAEVAIKEITDRLAGDFEFHMVTLRYDSTLPRISQEGSVLVHRIGPSLANPSIADLRRMPLRFLKVWFQFGAFFAARSLHKKYHYDALWAMMAHSAGVPAALFKKTHPQVPYLLTLQEGDPPEAIERQMRVFGGLFRSTFTRADVIQTISTFLAGWAKHRGARGRVEVVPNGVPFSLFNAPTSPDTRVRIRTRVGVHENETLLITASRLVHKNGIDTVIEALEHIPQTHFLVAGEGPLRKDLESLAQKCGVPERVHFEGEVPYQQLPEYLQASDVFVRASRSEGMGNAFIEAMAARIPVIGTSVGGIPDFLTEGETGYVVKPGNPKSITEAVERIRADREKAMQIVARAEALVRERYDWSRIALDMKDIFTSLWRP